MVKIANVFSMVYCYIFWATAVGCTSLPISLEMGGGETSFEFIDEKSFESDEPVSLFPTPPPPPTLDYRPAGVIIGNIGSGKTTLLNRLSGAQHEVSGSGGDSTTRELFQEPVAYGSNAFKLMDTPGINGEEEAYKHAYLLKTALEAVPYNAIFLVVKFDTGPQIKKGFLDLQRYVKNYKGNFVLMLSNCDKIDKRERSMAEENVAKLARKLGIRHTIMYSKYSNPTDLANAMYACMAGAPKIDIKVSEEDFIMDFQIWAAEDEMSIAYNEFEQEAERRLKEHLEQVKRESTKQESETDMANIIQAVGLSLADELEGIITDFETKYGMTMIDFNSYAAHAEMKKKKITTVDTFLKNTKPFLKWDISNRDDIRNQLKQCPHCAQFLIKTEGCDGITTCGNVPTKHDIATKESSSWYQHVVKRVDGKLTVIKEGLKALLPAKSRTEEIKSFVQSQLPPGAKLGLAGCGQEFEWGKAPFVSGEILDYVMEELNSTTEQAVKGVATSTKKKVKPKSDIEETGATNPEFIEARKRYEETIDTRIKSEMEEKSDED